MEIAELAEHGADAAHLEEHPLNGFVATCRIGWQELAGLLGEIEQDRARFEQGQRRTTGAVGIDDGRDLAVGIE
jgi:hypothetical protein